MSETVKTIEVVDRATGEVVKRVNVEHLSDRAVERCERGMNINMGAELQSRAGMRAIGRAVWCWSSLNSDQLYALYGSARVVAMLAEADAMEHQ